MGPLFRSEPIPCFRHRGPKPFLKMSDLLRNKRTTMQQNTSKVVQCQFLDGTFRQLGKVVLIPILVYGAMVLN